MNKNTLKIIAAVVVLLLCFAAVRKLSHKKGMRHENNANTQSETINTIPTKLMKTGAIEMLSYKPAEGKTLEQLLEQDKKVKNELVSKQPGYVNRYTSVTEDGTVNVFVHWESISDLEASQATVMQTELIGDYMGMMDQDSLSFGNLPVTQ
jgi:uncharacterized membrane protein